MDISLYFRMMKKIIVLFVSFMVCSAVSAENFINGISSVVKKMNTVDSSYILPKQHDWKVQMNYNVSQEYYNIRTDDGLKINLRTHTTNRLGPSIGYKMISGNLGFNLNANQNSTTEKWEWNANIFSPMFSLDLYYRNSAGDFVIRNVESQLKPEVKKFFDAASPLLDKIEWDMIETETYGGNIMYVFNHRKFSYPAAMTSSAVQLRSAGSPLAGFGYTHHAMINNYVNALQVLQWVYRNTKELPNIDIDIAEHHLCDNIHFNDYTLWGGYAYNWVPVRNMLVSASATLGLAYKTQKGSNENTYIYRGVNVFEPIGNKIRIDNDMFDMNFAGKASIQYNNSRFFFGTRFMYNYFGYNHGDKELRIDDNYWSLRLYVGLRFGGKKPLFASRKKKTRQ